MKKVLISVFMTFICLTMVGCGCQKEEKKPEVDPYQNLIDNTVATYGKFKVMNKEKSIDVIETDEKSTVTTTYSYEDDKLVKISIVQTYMNADLASTIYKQIKSDTSITKQYSKVSLKDADITYVYKKDAIEQYLELSKDGLFEILKVTYESATTKK